MQHYIIIKDLSEIHRISCDKYKVNDVYQFYLSSIISQCRHANNAVVKFYDPEKSIRVR